MLSTIQLRSFVKVNNSPWAIIPHYHSTREFNKSIKRISERILGRTWCEAMVLVCVIGLVGLIMIITYYGHIILRRNNSSRTEPRTLEYV